MPKLPSGCNNTGAVGKTVATIPWREKSAWARDNGGTLAAYILTAAEKRVDTKKNVELVAKKVTPNQKKLLPCRASQKLI